MPWGLAPRAFSIRWKTSWALGTRILSPSKSSTVRIARFLEPWARKPWEMPTAGMWNPFVPALGGDLHHPRAADETDGLVPALHQIGQEHDVELDRGVLEHPATGALEGADGDGVGDLALGAEDPAEVVLDLDPTAGPSLELCFEELHGDAARIVRVLGVGVSEEEDVVIPNRGQRPSEEGRDQGDQDSSFQSSTTPFGALHEIVTGDVVPRVVVEGPVVGHGDEETRGESSIEDRRGDVGTVALVGRDADDLDEAVVVRIAGFTLAGEDAEGVALLVGDQDVAGSVVDGVDRDPLALVSEAVGAEEGELDVRRPGDRGRRGIS